MNKNLSTEKLRYSTASKQDLIIALDRLTRFKYPEVKYYRVFSDILCKYLIEPKLSKNEILELPVEDLKSIIEKIWNESVEKHLKKAKLTDCSLNKILLKESEDCYVLSDKVRRLIDNKIDIAGVLEFIEKDDVTPINLKRLMLIKENEDLISLRTKYGLRFPIEKVVLCEGATEDILLPQFSRLAGYDFDKNGVKIISAGGKNKVGKFYMNFKEELKIPVFILLDADAIEIEEIIRPNLREGDKIYLIKHGEFEDIFSLNLIKRTINNNFKNICECCIADFKKTGPMTKTLTEFYRIHELGDYQKADFAKQLADNVKYETDLTDELCQIIEEIKKL